MATATSKPAELSRARTWILAARPRTLGAAFAPVLIGTAMAASDGALHVGAALAALWGAAWIQIGTNFANDYFDFVKGADTAERVGPTRATAAGMVSPLAMKRAFLLAFSLVVPVGAYLAVRGGWPIALIGVLSIASGILYTGGPKPLGYIGIADLFVLVFFGPVAVGGTYWVQAHHLPPEVLLAGLAPGLICTSMLTANNLRDVDTDRRAGKRTLAVRFGPTFARVELTAGLVGGLAIPVALVAWTGAHPLALLSLVAGLPAAGALRSTWTLSGAALNPVLGATGKVLVVQSLLFAVGWLL